MEQSRLLIAILLSLAVFLAWHFIFGPKEAERQAAKNDAAPAVTQPPAKDQETPYRPVTQKAETE